MRKLLRLSKMLLVAVGMLVGASNAWGTPTVIKTYDFETASKNATKETAVSYSGSTAINKIACDNLTGDWSGIALQGANAWFINRGDAHKYDGLYNNNSGGRTFGILDLKAGDIVTINANGGLATSGTNGTYDSANSTEGTKAVFTIDADGNFGISVTRYYQITTVTITRDVADLEAPTYTITGVNGVERQVTISCLTADATLKYNTTNDKSADGWKTYSAPFYTSETTLYAYSEKSGNTSEVITITTGAGDAIKLNSPVITKTAYADGNYTVSISSNQSSLSVVPASPVIKYSIDGDAAQTYSAPIAVAAGKTISAYVEFTGYTTSDKANATTTVRPVCALSWTQDYTNLTSAAGNGPQALQLSSTSFTIGETDFYNIVSYGESSTAVSVNTNVGLNTKSGFYFRTNGANSGILRNSGGDGYIGIQNLKVGDYIVVNSMNAVLSADKGVTFQEGMSTVSEYYFLATATEASIVVPVGTYNYIKTISVYSTSIPATITAAGWSTLYTDYALDFSGVDGLTAYTATCDGSKVTLTKVENVPAGTGVVLKGAANTYDIPVIASSATAKGDLKGSTTETKTYDTANNYYYLALNGKEAQFKKLAEGGSIAAGKAYLQLSISGAPSLNIDLGGTTGINAVQGSEFTVNGEYYNLAGQRVAQPTKGLYIVNGKKVVVK
ncbi:MAG: hypothetical protein IJ614_07075 [Prevotella sp.]|nr:hypothetical protein [Prevotella sp.]